MSVFLGNHRIWRPVQLRCKWGSHRPANPGASADPQFENPPRGHFLRRVLKDVSTNQTQGFHAELPIAITKACKFLYTVYVPMARLKIGQKKTLMALIHPSSSLREARFTFETRDMLGPLAQKSTGDLF